MLDVELYTPDIRPVVLDDVDLEIPFEKLSVTGRSTVPVDADYDRLAYVIQRDALRNGRRGNQNGNHNAVDIARIQTGADVRTTVSYLRCLPCLLLTSCRSCCAISQTALIKPCSKSFLIGPAKADMTSCTSALVMAHAFPFILTNN